MPLKFVWKIIAMVADVLSQKHNCQVLFATSASNAFLGVFQNLPAIKEILSLIIECSTRYFVCQIKTTRANGATYEDKIKIVFSLVITVSECFMQNAPTGQKWSIFFIEVFFVGRQFSWQKFSSKMISVTALNIGPFVYILIKISFDRIHATFSGAFIITWNIKLVFWLYCTSTRMCMQRNISVNCGLKQIYCQTVPKKQY